MVYRRVLLSVLSYRNGAHMLQQVIFSGSALAISVQALRVIFTVSRQLLFFKAKKLGLAQLDNVALLGVATCAMGAFYKVCFLVH